MGTFHFPDGQAINIILGDAIEVQLPEDIDVFTIVSLGADKFLIVYGPREIHGVG